MSAAKNTPLRQAGFFDMVRDGIVGKRCLTASRLFGLLFEGFLSERPRLLPLRDDALCYNESDPRYANLYAHVQETEQRLLQLLCGGKRIESLRLLSRDAAIEAALKSINRGYIVSTRAQKNETILVTTPPTATDYDRLWQWSEQGSHVVFYNLIPTDRRFYRCFFAKKSDERGLLKDTYIKKERSAGNVLLIQSECHATAVLKAALDDVCRGEVWVEDTYPTACPVAYLAKRIDGKNVYLFYNPDETRRASQYVRLPHAVTVVALDPKSGGTWLPEQQRYEKETWFKLWLGPEEGLVYITDGKQQPLLFAEDYPQKTNWAPLDGDTRIQGYGARAEYFPTAQKSDLRLPIAVDRYRLSFTLTGKGSFTLFLGEALLSVTDTTLCYQSGKQKTQGTLPKAAAHRLHIFVTDTLTVTREDVPLFTASAPSGATLAMEGDGQCGISGIYLVAL